MAEKNNLDWTSIPYLKAMRIVWFVLGIFNFIVFLASFALLEPETSALTGIFFITPLGFLCWAIFFVAYKLPLLQKNTKDLATIASFGSMLLLVVLVFLFRPFSSKGAIINGKVLATTFLASSIFSVASILVILSLVYFVFNKQVKEAFKK